MTAVAGSEPAGVAPRLAAAAAWTVGAVSLAGFAAAWVLAAHNRDLGDVTSGFGPDRFLVAYAAGGAIVASRRPGNPIGWFLVGIGVLLACRAVAGEYALHALAGSARPASGVWAAWFLNWSLTLVFPVGLLLFLLLLFPDGRPVTARWWAVGWLGAGLGALFLLVDWFYPGPMQVSGLPGVPNPTGIRGWAHVNPGGLLGNAAWALGGTCLVAAAVSVFLRYRRSAGEERLQLTLWLTDTVSSSAVPGESSTRPAEVEHLLGRDA